MSMDKPRIMDLPWRLDDYGLHVFGSTSMKICDVRGWGHLTGRGALNLPEDEAIEIQKTHGRVIAAAPDLLKVLEEIEWDGVSMCPRCHMHFEDGHSETCELKAALAKARGEA